jgi:hypothetical protein
MVMAMLRERRFAGHRAEQERGKEDLGLRTAFGFGLHDVRWIKRLYGNHGSQSTKNPLPASGGLVTMCFKV